jgi:hypothetical protein
VPERTMVLECEFPAEVISDMLMVALSNNLRTTELIINELMEIVLLQVKVSETAFPVISVKVDIIIGLIERWYNILKE